MGAACRIATAIGRIKSDNPGFRRVISPHQRAKTTGLVAAVRVYAALCDPILAIRVAVDIVVLAVGSAQHCCEKEKLHFKV